MKFIILSLVISSFCFYLLYILTNFLVKFKENMKHKKDVKKASKREKYFDEHIGNPGIS